MIAIVVVLVIILACGLLGAFYIGRVPLGEPKLRIELYPPVLEDLDIDGTAKIRDQAGIRIWQGANNRVSRCRIRKVGFGVLLSNPWDGPYLCKGNIIEGCDIHHVYVGIYLLNRCDKGILRANHCHETEPEDASYVGKDGILIESCSHVLVEGNICDNNEEHGIYLAVSSSADVGSEHVCIVGNILYNNKQVGIHLNGQASMKIRKCTVTGNVCAFSQQARGIELDSYCEGNTVTGNAVFRNSLFGILETPGQNDYNAIVASASTQNGSAEGDQISKAGTNSFEEDNIKIYLWT